MPKIQSEYNRLKACRRRETHRCSCHCFLLSSSSHDVLCQNFPLHDFFATHKVAYLTLVSSENCCGSEAKLFRKLSI